MRRLIRFVPFVAFLSGCYTMIHHPGAEDPSVPVEARDSASCTACHAESDLEALAWWRNRPGGGPSGLQPLWGPPLAVREPWWWRTSAPAPGAPAPSPHPQGAGLVNDRPPLSPGPPAAAVVPSVGGSETAPRSDEPAATPRGLPAGTPHPSDRPALRPPATPRGGQATPSPHPGSPADSLAPGTQPNPALPAPDQPTPGRSERNAHPAPAPSGPQPAAPPPRERQEV